MVWTSENLWEAHTFGRFLSRTSEVSPKSFTILKANTGALRLATVPAPDCSTQLKQLETFQG